MNGEPTREDYRDAIGALKVAMRERDEARQQRDDLLRACKALMDDDKASARFATWRAIWDAVEKAEGREVVP